MLENTNMCWWPASVLNLTLSSPKSKSAGQNHNIRNANKSFENVAKFKHLGMRVTIIIIEEYL